MTGPATPGEGALPAEPVPGFEGAPVVIPHPVRSYARLAALNAFPLGMSVFWNSVHPLLLPLLVSSLVAAGTENTWLGGITFLGLVLAMVVQPVAGAWSDRVVTKWGRRRPLMLLGTLGSLPFALGMGMATTLAWLLATYLLLQLVSNLVLGAYQGLVPDRVAPDRRGIAAGARNFADVLGVVIAALALPPLVSGGDPGPGFTIAILAYAAGVTVTILSIREYPVEDPAGAPAPQPGLSRVLTAMVFDPRRHKPFAWLILSRLLFVIGLTTIQTFALFFIRDVLQPPSAVELWGTLTQAIGITILVITLPAGRLSDRIGRRPLIVLSALVASGGAVLFLFARDPLTVLVVGCLVGIGVGGFLAANWALAIDLAPPEEAARFLGLTNLATAGGAALARLVGPGIDAGNTLGPDFGYLGMISTVAACFFLAGIAGLFGRQKHQPVPQ